MHLWRIPNSEHGGLVSRAAPGTHEAVVEHVASLGLSPDAQVLDLAAGTGALLSRMRAAGFRSLSAIERDVNNFGLSGLTPLPLDLNTTFADQVSKSYELITAVEIIEHLDSPRDFLRQIHALLEPGGYCIVSTPNVAHWLGRLQFLLFGTMKYFSYQDYLDQRHISPILDMHFKIMAKELDFELVRQECTASSWGVLIRALTLPLSMLFRLTGGGDTDGNVNIYVLRKPLK